MQIVLSEADEIVEPTLHDARLTGIALLGDGSARLGIQRLDGSQVELVLYEVIRLQMDGFCEGNVVLDVTLTPVGDGSLGDVAAAYGAAIDSSFLAPELKRLRDLGAVVFRLNPSFGASLVSVCRRVEARVS
jgi:hypothetical protein